MIRLACRRTHRAVLQGHKQRCVVPLSSSCAARRQLSSFPEEYLDYPDDMDSQLAFHTANIESMKVKELKDLLKENGLKVSGNKADLQERVKNMLLGIPEEEPPSPVDTTDDNDDDSSNMQEEEEEEMVEPPQEENPEYTFDVTNNYELVPLSKLQDDDAVMFTPEQEPTLHDVHSLLQLVPHDWVKGLSDDSIHNLMELVLDVGRRPFAWISGERHFLSNDTVSQQLLQDISATLHFGADNRAGIDGSLHRISSIRNRDGLVVGLTLRVGRFVPGNSLMIADILAGKPNASILFVGGPGTGKTSIIRDAARFLAEKQSLLIVDTSCEIGGSGDIPHECIGLSRRMQVKSIDAQASVMVECVQNHTPAVMVIDEIGREAEVRAALTCKERGVRIIASAHGNLPGLVRNSTLCDLIGGVEVVTVGDKAAKDDAKRRKRNMGGIVSKLKAQRRGPPIFDVIVELRRGKLHDWQVVLHCASAVDSILSDGKYSAQVRTREDSGAGKIRVKRITQDAHDLDKIIEEAHKSESMLNSFPMSDEVSLQTDDLQSLPSHLNPYNSNCKTCPNCNRLLKNRRGFIVHAFQNNQCRPELPHELLDALYDEAVRQNMKDVLGGIGA